VTTSDDKGFRVWESSIPVCQKWHTDMNCHSMPSSALHPSGKFVATQNLNNTIQVFETFGKYKHRKKKVYSGHLCAGYSIQINFSNDGKFIMSGDSEGKVYIWDFKSTKLLKTIQAHDSGIF
jgi:pre-mRNA-processing factor 17